MPRPVALRDLIARSDNPELDARVCLAVALGARAAHEIAQDVGAPLPQVWAALRRLIDYRYITAPHPIFGIAPTRKGETVARAVYDTRTFTFVPPVPEPADHELGGAA